MSTEVSKISARARKALEVLKNGGRYVRRLERDKYTGREQFVYRLLKDGKPVKGFGLATFYEIKDEFLAMCDHNTSVSTYYQLRTQG